MKVSSVSKRRFVGSLEDERGQGTVERLRVLVGQEIDRLDPMLRGDGGVRINNDEDESCPRVAPELRCEVEVCEVWKRGWC